MQKETVSVRHAAVIVPVSLEDLKFTKVERIAENPFAWKAFPCKRKIFVPGTKIFHKNFARKGKNEVVQSAANRKMIGVP
jgi:hypothetical protein